MPQLTREETEQLLDLVTRPGVPDGPAAKAAILGSLTHQTHPERKDAFLALLVGNLFYRDAVRVVLDLDEADYQRWVERALLPPDGDVRTRLLRRAIFEGVVD